MRLPKKIAINIIIFTFLAKYSYFINDIKSLKIKLASNYFKSLHLLNNSYTQKHCILNNLSVII